MEVTTGLGNSLGVRYPDRHGLRAESRGFGGSMSWRRHRGVHSIHSLAPSVQSVQFRFLLPRGIEIERFAAIVVRLGFAVRLGRGIAEFDGVGFRAEGLCERFGRK